jgi:GNAT superfamily N-acetyltransferase
MWRRYVASALRYPWTLVTPGVEAAAVWIPPGGTELTPEEEDGLEDLLVQTAGADVAQDILAIYDQLEAAHPAEPCYYLSLLGVHDDHRGRGIGMALLADSLARIDALGAPAYLESSNPANLARYGSVGFVPRDEITIATGHVVTTMWRPAR